MPTATRTFRVFISSTFEDLKAERDALQRDVFPRLRKLCEEHGARFQAIDLRWGVRDEAAIDQQTMEICLREIERCQQTGIKPNFIVLLGERYGWRPLPARIEAEEFNKVRDRATDADKRLIDDWYERDENAVPPELLLKPRTGEFADKDRWGEVEQKLHRILRVAARDAGLAPEALIKYEASATHQEILKGLGESEEDRRHVFAFFRYPVEGAKVDPELEALEGDLRRKLTEANVRPFRIGEIEKLCTGVEESLKKVILDETSKFTSCNALDLEIEAHDRFAADRCRIFVGRGGALTGISDYLRGPERQPLVLHGESGSGKSAVMAKASEQYKGRGRVIRRFVGVSPESTSGLALLTSICRQISPGETPFDYYQLERVFKDQLANVTSEQPLVLFIDALDQLPSSDPAREARWLPAELPPFVKVVVSTTGDGERLPSGLPLRLERMIAAEGGQALDALLRDARRTLQPGQRETVLSHFERCGLPLYFKLAAEESRLWMSFSPPDTCALGEGIAGILDTLFDRLASNANHGPVVVSRSLGYLAAARYGLTEDEMLDVLSVDEEVWQDFLSRAHHTPPEHRLPVIVWSRLFLDLEPYLTERAVPGGTTVSFYHRQLADRVASTPQFHSNLAEYFQSRQPMNARKASEWPWQLRAAGAWQSLLAALTDLDLFDALYNDEHKWELGSYWVPLREKGYDLEKSYAEVIRRGTNGSHRSEGSELVYRIASFLIENGGRTTGKELMDLAATGSADADYATAQGALAFLLEERGDFETALAVRKQILDTHALRFGPKHRFTATACLNLAGTYLHMERLAEAEVLAKRALMIDEESSGGGQVEVAKDLITLGECLRRLNRLGDAEAALQRALAIARERLPAQDPLFATILGNLGSILVETGRPEDAEPLILQAVDIERAVLGNKNPKLAIRLNNLAFVRRANGRIQQALDPAQEALSILVDHSLNSGYPHVYLHNAAKTLASMTTEAGLAPELAVAIVNNLLTPVGLRLMPPEGTEPIDFAVSDTGMSIRRSPPAVADDGDSETRDAQLRTACDTVARPVSVTPGTPQMTTETTSTRSDEEIAASPLSELLRQLDPSNLRERAWKGDPRAQVSFAVHCESEGKVAEAALWYRRAAEQGIAQAQFNLGVLLMNGIGVDANLPEAVKWYESAAAQGYLNAIYNLAFMRENGLGCAQDPHAAFDLYEEAAVRGEPDSQCKLAILLMDESQQKQIGYNFRVKTDDQLFARATKALRRLFRLTGPAAASDAPVRWSDIPVNSERAREFLQDAARNGHSYATEMLRTLGWN